MTQRNSKFVKDSDTTTILYMIAMIVTSFLCTAFSTWAIVEFILYLVKDNPFNWVSLWLTIAAFVLEIFFFIRAWLADN